MKMLKNNLHHSGVSLSFPASVWLQRAAPVPGPAQLPERRSSSGGYYFPPQTRNCTKIL